MDWLKHAIVFKLPLGDTPNFAQAFIQKETTDDEHVVWVVSRGKMRSRLAADGSGWIENPANMLKLDVMKAIPQRAAELEDYRRRTYFETKEQALDTYVAWRHSQGDMCYAPDFIR